MRCPKCHRAGINSKQGKDKIEKYGMCGYCVKKYTDKQRKKIRGRFGGKTKSK